MVMRRQREIEISYRAYATNKIGQAIEAYEGKMGQKATLVIARPEMALEDQHELLVRSEFGAASCLLVTHMLPKESFEEGFSRWKPTTRQSDEAQEREALLLPLAEKAEMKRGRPKRDGDICPMCSQKIRDFDKLGFWWGWERGIAPPYWDELRSYVLNRDDYTCQKCGVRLPGSNLALHHIKPKEIGGSDSAKNLTTLCKACHRDTKPIMSDEDEGNWDSTGPKERNA